MGTLALVGTRKGIFFLLEGDDPRKWETEGPLLDGWGVYHAVVDARDGTIYAAANHLVYGPTVQRSTDGGRTWKRSQQLSLPEDCGLTVNAAWHVEPGRPQEPQTLYLGADPGVLFSSHDHGATWEPNRAAYNLDRIRSFKAKHRLDDAGQVVERPRQQRARRRSGTWTDIVQGGPAPPST
jgi:photosystem II stability/assembly factor-like uncharacterized protein